MGALATTAFLVGLAGGVHCAAMCGGIVAALNLRASVSMPAGARFGRQLAYSLGRVASYAVAGAVAGGVGGLGLLYDGVLPARLILLIIANALIILLGLYLAGLGTAVLALERAGGVVWRNLARLGARLTPAETSPRAVAVGLAWGWIPCGLVYSVLATALVSGSALAGAAVMAAFGLGTLPNLLAMGLVAQKLQRFLRRPRVRLAAGLAVALLGVIGLARVPGLSEHLKHGLHSVH
ncbi:MAG TPA: sulfite exporter TauE/SafE family protein [Thermoanaerobaculia bacterium]|nr:sulfite exporter TauE/SafE family protein [Thermoanaerobaculia bacterium]